MADTLSLTVNGQSMTLPLASTVADFVTVYAPAGRRVAVERNGEIVPKSQHTSTPLAEGDCLEVVVAVGGG